MRKFSILLSILVLAAMVLAACGGEETATNLPSTQIPEITADATEAMTEPATEAPTEEATGTPGVPVTGDVNPARLSNQLDFTVWSQDGEQIGEVDDMVLDLDNTRVAYVIVGTGGFLDLGERTLLVPWDSLQLQSGTGDTIGGQQNAFVLQGDVDMFRNAPDFDLTNLPQMGQPAEDWDADIRNFWESGGTGTGQATEGAATGEATQDAGAGQATATSGTGAGTGQATATSETGTGTGQATATSGAGTGQATATAGTGTGQGEGTTTLQGVVLASEILGSTVSLSAQGTGTGQATEPAATSAAGTDQATATAGTGAGTGQATATSGAGTGAGQATATSGTGTGTGQATETAETGDPGTGTDQGPMTATVEDMILDTDAGEILYIVLNAAFTDAERWIPVPLNMFQWDAGMQGFAFSGDATMLQGAPFFEDGQFPDTTTSDWNTEFDMFWQNSGAGGGTGTGTGTGGATATATP